MNDQNPKEQHDVFDQDIYALGKNNSEGSTNELIRRFEKEKAAGDDPGSLLFLVRQVSFLHSDRSNRYFQWKSHQEILRIGTPMLRLC